MRNMSLLNFMKKMSTVRKIYQIDNFEVDALSWYEYWATSSDECDDEFVALLSRTKLNPAVRDALLILLTLPATTCTVE